MKKTVLSIAIISAGILTAISNNGGNKVVICHQTGNGESITIEVNEKAVAAHIAHGDAIGECAPDCDENTYECILGL
ncbi:MAG: hypothetical protein JKY53_00465 [Flavobacteriales bacterium]|nr:hypothetical protein [Flavobacteriales bacterium]